MKYFLDGILRQTAETKAPAGAVELTDEQYARLASGLYILQGGDVVPVPVRALSPAEIIAQYTTALDTHIDAVARADKWDSRITCALRAGYPNQWQAKGIAFGVWMDACYTQAYQIMADVQAQTRTLPSIEEFIAEMPVMEWPA